jgi:2-succinyl-5-enolpyruvyl-6-hydroxy-3-cyclohexene-1-carboxylate synthase
MSGARRGPAAVAHYDALLRDPSFAASMAPDVVLRVGDLPVSKPLRAWLASQRDARQVALDAERAWQDPDSVLAERLELDPAAALEQLARDNAVSGAEDGWLASWRAADERAAEALLGVLAPPALSEPRVALELGVLLPSRGTLFVASSMPVRDIETVWPVRDDPPRVLCNRGANGIDGTVSAAFGAVDAGGDPVVLLIGDVALAHDIGGLLAARRLGLRLTIVVLDNGGGGIFDFLPVSGAAIATRDAHGGELYETHIATPTGLDFARAGDLYGVGHERVTDIGSLRIALERALSSPQTAIVEVPCDRAANVALHRRMWDAVAGAVSPRAAGAAPAA